MVGLGYVYCLRNWEVCYWSSHSPSCGSLIPVTQCQCYYVSLTCTGLFTVPPPPPQFSLIPLSVSSLLCLMADRDVDSCCRCCMILARRAATTTAEPPTPSSNRPTTPLPTTDHDVQVRIRLHFWHSHLIQCQSCSMSIVMVLSCPSYWCWPCHALLPNDVNHFVCRNS